ncbi:ClpP/crotonase-like domain-containing protein [Phanerochaete sordida]|uniref:ClpP/crotonase-like domain-containing protein n=1 Tax=Phanerochaete sordida TaxID=48140 RepID=A0A9P3G3H4_9APHY|nr:ClpP/crotonase-like domain-containing protein [Phanerochaete sordida]
MKPGVNVEISQGIATITFNRPKSLNAITAEDYDAFAEALHAIDKRSDVIVTVWQAMGKFFCSGTDVTKSMNDEKESVRQTFINRVVRANTDVSHALYTHSKLLVAALNGPVIGIAAAFLGHFDFIYCMPNVYLSLPFPMLGIITEAGSSVNFVRRLGIAKANEVLILGKKLTSQDLLDTGFINKIFNEQPVEAFQAAVRKHVQEELDSLDHSACLHVKQLIKAGLAESNNPDAVNLRESYAQAARIASGVPAERFGKIARKEIKHKL